MNSSLSSPEQKPESDVSSAVGLVGLAGLFLWIVICRSWPTLSELLDLSGPRLPMTGSSAVLMCLVFSGGPMALWSLCVEKVHRRPSTGIAWDNPRLIAEILPDSITKLAGLWATWGIIGVLYCLGRWYWSGQYIFAMEVLGASLIPLVLLSIPYVLWLDRVLIEPRDGAWHFGAMMIGRDPYDADKVLAHLRAWAVKGFFCAFMISILPGGFSALVQMDFATLPRNPVALAQFLISIFFFIDVQIAMVGYLLTMRPLDSHIRSANPHMGGWVAALICYPPFILMGDGGPLNYHLGTAEWTYWLSASPNVMVIWSVILAALTGFYAWATVIFGLRFSNLTYRGVITNGPYSFTRHPAYLSKNLFWWLATMPFLATTGSAVDIIRNTALLAGVSGVYYWRARTEEAHLLAEDPKYREYHGWMAEHAPITRCLGKVLQFFVPRGPKVGS